MATKMFFNSENCTAATSGTTGKEYKTDKNGFVHVDDRDVKSFKDGGYIVAGAMPRVSSWWECNDCSWSAVINHCPKCGSESLTKIEK